MLRCPPRSFSGALFLGLAWLLTGACSTATPGHNSFGNPFVPAALYATCYSASGCQSGLCLMLPSTNGGYSNSVCSQACDSAPCPTGGGCGKAPDGSMKCL